MRKVKSKEYNFSSFSKEYSFFSLPPSLRPEVTTEFPLRGASLWTAVSVVSSVVRSSIRLSFRSFVSPSVFSSVFSSVCHPVLSTGARTFPAFIPYYLHFVFPLNSSRQAPRISRNVDIRPTNGLSSLDLYFNGTFSRLLFVISSIFGTFFHQKPFLKKICAEEDEENYFDSSFG